MGQDISFTDNYVDTCGDIVYVNLSDNPVSLREWIGPPWDVWQSYGEEAGYRHAGTWENDFPCNWKIVVENSVESYHIPLVHPHTFKKYPDDTNAWHELNERFSTFRTVAFRDLGTRSENWFTRRLGAPVTNEYHHRLIHPHDAVRLSDGADVVPVPVHFLHFARPPAESLGVADLPHVARGGKAHRPQGHCGGRGGL